MQVAAPSFFNYTDQLTTQTALIGRLQHAMAINSKRINSAEDAAAVSDSQAAEALAEFGKLHHAVSASLRANQFISSAFLFDPLL